MNNAYIDLRIIKNIHFTDREIDVIACLMSGKAYKKIALLLAISSKTVELHIRNIVAKLRCNSKEGIIDFIEKSDKFILVKQHYSYILVKSAFEQELCKITTIVPKISICCLIVYYEKQKTKNTLFCQLEKHLNLIGIKTITKCWDANKHQSFFKDEVEIRQIDHVVYALSDDFVDRLTVAGYRHKLVEEASSLAAKIKESPKPIIFIVATSKLSAVSSQNSVDLTELNLAEHKDYYCLFFELLKLILYKNNINSYIADFKKQSDILTQPTYPVIASIKNSKFNPNWRHKLLSFKWVILLVSILCFGFLNTIKNKNTINDSQQVKNIKQQVIALNLPPRNHNFIGREQALQWIAKRLNSKDSELALQVITGLGGIGKTQLVTEFAYQVLQKNEYKAILWVNAETVHTINSVYADLANYLQINTNGLDSKQIQASIHRYLVEKYKNHKMLIILDNVANYPTIQDYILTLHKQLAPDFTLHVLATSRSQNWPDLPLALDSFTPEEAKIFVTKQLISEKEAAVVTLTNRLCYFPLALSQAVAYIKTHTNIEDYLNLYTAKQKEYLDKFPNDKCQHVESLWKTWSITLTKLSSAAKHILIISSYLNNDNIPFSLFSSLATEERVEAIEELRRYSFINIIDNNSFRIHRLLQQVVRMTISPNDQSTYLAAAMKLLKSKCDFNYSKSNEWQNYNQYLAHAQSLAEYAISREDNSFNTGIQLYSRIAMFLTYMRQDNQSAEELWQKILTLLKQKYGNDKSLGLILARINTHLCHISRHLNNKQATKYLDKTIITYEQNIPSISYNAEQLLSCLRWEQNLTPSDGIKCDYANSLLMLGYIKRDLTDFSAAKKLYGQALTIVNECKNIEHILLYKMIILQSLADINIYTGDLEAAKHDINTAQLIADSNYSAHLESAYIYERFAYLWYYNGLYQQAKSNIETTLAIRFSKLSMDHYRIGLAKAILGLILCANDQIHDGLEQLKQAESIHNKNYKADHYQFISMFLSMSYGLEKNQEYDRALQYLEKTRVLVRKNSDVYKLYWYQFSPIEKLPVISNLKNISYYLHALPLIEELFGKDHIRTARYHYLLGLALQNNGDHKQARQHFYVALNISNKQHFSDKTLAIEHQKNMEIIHRHLTNKKLKH